MPLFSNPAVLLAFYDPFFQTGQFKICPWQVKIHAEFAGRMYGQPKSISVAAPNGSGKSSLLTAPAAIWTAMSFQQARTVITSASVAQLDMQTMPAAKSLAMYVNKYHGTELWDIQHRLMEFKPTGSIIQARKSDLEGTQEGFHPLIPGGEFTILVDEAKSISQEIWNGILKWTGFTRRMDVSSAGEPSGPFFQDWCSGTHPKFRITYKDCPHISQADVDKILVAAKGINTPLARQILLSEFATLAGSVVITLEDVERCIRLGKEGAIKHKPTDQNNAGLDLSGGGDETILCVCNGNKQLAIETVPFYKEDQIEDHIAHVLIPKWNLRLENIRADAGGLGRPMIRNIMQKVRARGGGHGDNICMVYNQSPPQGVLKGNFGNRGTEMWHRFAGLMSDCVPILLDDLEQTTQLSNRYFRQQVTSDKIILEPKAEAKARGHPSPDRADALVLAMSHYRHEEKKPQESPRQKMTGEELEHFIDELNAGRFNKPKYEGALTLEQLVGPRHESNNRR